ncbi:hypothetical protein GCM10027160_14230 [Streptomyces calidiresistens]
MLIRPTVPAAGDAGGGPTVPFPASRRAAARRPARPEGRRVPAPVPGHGAPAGPQRLLIRSISRSTRRFSSGAIGA